MPRQLLQVSIAQLEAQFAIDAREEANAADNARGGNGTSPQPWPQQPQQSPQHHRPWAMHLREPLHANGSSLVVTTQPQYLQSTTPCE